jgi:hypothetical protein
MRTLFTSLAVIDNNGPDSVGGGGVPRVAPPPPLSSQCGVGVGSSDPIAPACPANFNCIGGITIQDIFDFLASYFAAGA